MRSCGHSRTVCNGSAWARIDILYVHDIGAMQHGREKHPAIMRTLRDGGYRALEELRGNGVVRAIGIGVNEREVLLEALEWGDWERLSARRGAIPCSSRRRSMISCRNAFPRCVDRRRRPAQFRDPRRARYLELQGRSSGGGRSG